MSTVTITRPTTKTDRERFLSIPSEDRKAVTDLAKKAAKRCTKASEAWAKAFDTYAASKNFKKAAAARSHGGGMPAGHKFNRVVGHRLVAIRAQHGECSCGEVYEAAGAEAQRAAHAAHKAQVGA